MRIFFLSYAYERGIRADAGGFRKLWELAWALQGFGHEVCVFFPRLPGFAPLRDVPCQAYPVLDRPVFRPLTAYLSMFRTALRRGRRVRPDVIYFRTGLNILPLWLGRLLQARVVLEVNADPSEFSHNEGQVFWPRLVTAIERFNAQSSDFVIALTPGLKRTLFERYGVSPHKIHVIPGGTDPDHFVPADSRAAKVRLGLASEQPVVGFVGLFYRHQGVHTLIKAIPQILREEPTTRFLIVGNGVMRSSWEELARQLGVAASVQFAGQIPYSQVPLYLQTMDVITAPFTTDRGETSPFKVLDALSCCRPVIASDLPSVRRLAEGFDGAITLIPPDNAEALAQTVCHLLRDPLRQHELGRRGRAGILRGYTWQTIASDLLAVLQTARVEQNLLHRSPQGPTLRARLGSASRTVVSLAPILRVVPRPSRPQGLSAIVRVKDEAEWLDLSIRSIREVADEIIIGDNGSTDQTPEILEKLQREFGNQLVVLKRPELDIKDLTNILLQQTRFRWVMRWDADFVARTDGPQAIAHLREWLSSLDPRRYIFAYLGMVELCGDLFHQRPENAFRADCHCFTYSDHLRYVYDRVGYESPRVPRWYQVLRHEIPTFFHADVKPARRMFLSFLWKQYLTDPERGRYPGFKGYVEAKLKTRWGGKQIEEAEVTWALLTFKNLIPYDRDRFGDYPTLLTPFLEKPTYRLLYKDGQIVGRREPECQPDSAEKAASEP